MTTDTFGNGAVSGAGSYDTNAVAVLTPTPAGGSVFSHWTGDAAGSVNPRNLIMDSGKSVVAHFIPEPAGQSVAMELGFVPESQIAKERADAVQGVIDDPNPFDLFTTDQMHGLALGKPVLERDPGSGRMNLQLGLKRSVNLTDWFELGILLEDVDVIGGKLDLRITPEGNAAFYQIEGTAP